ncbi:hypothetical protein O7635_01150 [Asanoa sp. WMMD1127]|uniref:hypothetical protein n=1 Tax=Asanoa sp. WMMD1127 TaxID=3016107 RepID=UPI002416B9AC|nr:hypothetical protein [Asanoa sp. WMMD1127]MDG4820458.1 hypothetical protein [Asanoa sp. WMMD1127]
MRGRFAVLAKRELRVRQALAIWAYVAAATTAVSGIATTSFLSGGSPAGSAAAAYIVTFILSLMVPRLRSKMQWRTSWFQLNILALTSLLVITWSVGGAHASGDFYPRYVDLGQPRPAGHAIQIAAGITGSLASTAVLLFLVLGFSAVRRLLLLKSIDDVVAIRVARVIAWLRRSDLHHRDHASRRHASAHLEVAADIIEHAFPRILWLPAASSNAALREYFRNVGQHVREYQIWIMTPGSNTRNDLLGALARIYGAIALREMASLPADPTLRLSRPHRARSIIDATRALLVGLLPLASVLVLQWRGIKLPSPLDTGAITIAGLWAFASVMMLIDPAFSTRLASVKDIAAAFRGVGPGSSRTV